MKINQYEATESLQNIKLFGANDSQTVGIPFETVKEQVFKDANATPEKNGLMSKEDKTKLDELVESVVKGLILASHPVGSIEVNVSGLNPGTYLGGTWVAWGSGRVPVGVTPDDENFNAVEKIGGAKSYTHTHGLAGHSHSISSHGHSINNHTHSINEKDLIHKHHIASHSHTVNSHKHTQTMRFQSAYAEAAGGGVKYTNGESVPTNIIYTGESAPGTNGVELWTDAPSVSIAGGAYISTTGSGTLSTNESGTLNTNDSGTLTTEADSINILQPYITCYMWKRTK